MGYNSPMNDTQRDAGFVVCRGTTSDTGQIDVEYLLLRDAEYRTWDFPKGKLEYGESELAAAERELEEEAGIRDVTALSGFRETTRYEHPGADLRMISKTTVFFLGITRARDVLLSKDHDDHGFLKFPDAWDRLKGRSRDVLAKARRFLQGF
jgi:8-oxo-dGTP pyrophosphatase MutT (NUDIX family)